MFDEFSMAAPHSKRTVGEDIIFKVNREAGQAAQRYGAANIVNASVGSLLDDGGNLAVIPTVIEILRGLEAEDFSAYAPIAGVPQFLDAAKEAVFRENRISGYTGIVATPGGTGGIRHTIWNYSENGDSVLTADWYWGPYRNIAEEHGRVLETFTLFDDKNCFNITSFKIKIDEILTRQRRIVILLNSPANNPTGYNLSEKEWDEVIITLKEKAQDMGNRIILFIDIAYIDYSGESKESRKFISKFENLPKNILIIFGFSMSKSYTLYGMRSGAIIGLSSSENIAKEFRAVNESSNRGTWSNGTRPAMMVLSKIFSDDKLFERVEREREELRVMLKERASAFIEQSAKAGLPICPYKAGFFISLPCENPKVITGRLQEDNIFAVPIPKGIRFAICSVSKKHCATVPALIMKAMEI